MCRQIAVPSGVGRKEILAILRHFCGKNVDGVGYVQVVNGGLRVRKWPRSLHWAIRNTDFLQTVPHDGWTLIHLRAASHGSNVRRNTHPFVVGDRAVVHNGVWMDYNLSKLLLASQGTIIKGETDTEVGANVLNIIGPQKFASEVTGGGVFMALNRDGSLEVAQTSGDLVVHKYDCGKVLVSSELDEQKYPDAKDTVHGYMEFSKDGKYIRHLEKLSYTFPTPRGGTDEDDDDVEPIVNGGKMIRDFDKLATESAYKKPFCAPVMPYNPEGYGSRMLRLRAMDESDGSHNFGRDNFGFGGADGHWD